MCLLYFQLTLTFLSGPELGAYEPKKLQKANQFIKRLMPPNSIMNFTLYQNIACPQVVFLGDLMLCLPMAIEVTYS
ncbi:hypothetical protein BGX38DRAFT_1166274 [Terfezia claveryi]|nr:hypothetical protein BGX38DRAFT_1166274 [Terfezia claveryi]